MTLAAVLWSVGMFTAGLAAGLRHQRKQLEAQLAALRRATEDLEAHAQAVRVSATNGTVKLHG